MRPWSRRALKRVVKPGSKIDRALREVYLAAHEALRRLDQRRRLRGVVFADIYDREQWLGLLAALRCPAWTSEATSRAGAAGYVIEQYLLRHEAFPTGLSDGVHGAFAQAICEGLEAGAAGLVQAVFRDPPGSRVLQFYELEVAQREEHPLALTAVGRFAHVCWLLYPMYRAARQLEAYHVMWFALVCAEDASAGIVPTYQRNPAWQAMVPDGFGAGQVALARLAKACGIAFDGVLAVPAAQGVRRGARVGGAVGGGAVEGVNVIGYLSMTTGLGVAARNTVQAARLAGLEVSERDVRADVEPGVPPVMLGLEPHPVTFVHVTPGPWTERVYRHTGLARRGGVYRIGIWYWELESAPLEWRRQADYLDEVWCPTRFIADSVRRVMRVPVRDMLPGIELPMFSPRMRVELGLPDGKFLFLFMFDMYSTFARKDPLALIRAYREAFSAREDAHLVIKVNHAGADSLSLALLEREVARGGVTLIREQLSRADVYALVDACDAYVSLHRSEGYGLTIAEAMGLGKPVIATGYSGNVDFMSPDNSKLVGYRMVPVERTVGPYTRGSLWAQADTSEAAQWMRWAYTERAAARAMGARAKEDITRTTSLAAYGARIRQRLSEL